jgi:hypothetical protein
VVNDDRLDITQAAAEAAVEGDELNAVVDLDEDQEILDAEAAVLPLHPESEAS